MLKGINLIGFFGIYNIYAKVLMCCCCYELFSKISILLLTLPPLNSTLVTPLVSFNRGTIGLRVNSTHDWLGDRNEWNVKIENRCNTDTWWEACPNLNPSTPNPDFYLNLEPNNQSFQWLTDEFNDPSCNQHLVPTGAVESPSARVQSLLSPHSLGNILCIHTEREREREITVFDNDQAVDCSCNYHSNCLSQRLCTLYRSFTQRRTQKETHRDVQQVCSCQWRDGTC